MIVWVFSGDVICARPGKSSSTPTLLDFAGGGGGQIIATSRPPSASQDVGDGQVKEFNRRV